MGFGESDALALRYISEEYWKRLFRYDERLETASHPTDSQTISSRKVPVLDCALFFETVLKLDVQFPVESFPLLSRTGTL